MELHRLLKSERPWLHLLVAAESDACDLVAALPGVRQGREAARVIRGHKARTTAALFDEFAAALQFPCYFGENWDAFNECLADLDWLPGEGYVFLIVQSTRLLDQEPAEQFELLLSILERAGEEWSKAAGAPRPRPPRPFHVVLQCSGEDEAALGGKLTGARVAFDVLRP
jgi:Barstar (barnase inhibitor)